MAGLSAPQGRGAGDGVAAVACHMGTAAFDIDRKRSHPGLPPLAHAVECHGLAQSQQHDHGRQACGRRRRWKRATHKIHQRDLRPPPLPPSASMPGRSPPLWAEEWREGRQIGQPGQVRVPGSRAFGERRAWRTSLPRPCVHARPVDGQEAVGRAHNALRQARSPGRISAVRSHFSMDGRGWHSR